jgi:hypothetical protein
MGFRLKIPLILGGPLAKTDPGARIKIEYVRGDNQLRSPLS